MTSRQSIGAYRPQHQAHTHTMEHGHHVHGEDDIRQVSLSIEGYHAEQRQPVQGVQDGFGEGSGS